MEDVLDHYQYAGRDNPRARRIRLWFIRARAQARHQGWTWTITWPYFLSLWLLDNRDLSHGVGGLDLVFCRRDTERSWTEDNVYIDSRRNYLRRRLGKKYRVSKKTAPNQQNLVC